MAKKSRLSKLLEFIGVVDNTEPVYDPREGADGDNRFAYRAQNPREGARPRQEYTRTRINTAGRPIPNERPQRGEANRRERDNGALRRATNRDMRVAPSTIVYYMHSLEECSDVINSLISNKSVLLNFEEMDGATMQRTVDTLSGATFALRAKLRKVAEKMYLIVPENVQVNMTRSVERRY